MAKAGSALMRGEMMDRFAGKLTARLQNAHIVGLKSIASRAVAAAQQSPA